MKKYGGITPALLAGVLLAATAGGAGAAAPDERKTDREQSVNMNFDRNQVREKWVRALGAPAGDVDPRRDTLVETFDTPDFHGELWLQSTGATTRQKLLMMFPLGAETEPRPGMVVPFYHPDRVCGYDLTRPDRPRLPAEKSLSWFALHLVRQGYVVAACEAYPFNLIEQPADCVDRNDFGWWKHAAVELHRRWPEWTGVGKLASDTRRAIDHLAADRRVDATRIGAMGHSLGGKMAFYAGGLDERVKAVISSDFGIGWKQTNWDDPWYWDGRVDRLAAAGLEHWQLLAIKAPMPFFLIAGQFDGPESCVQLDAARRIYAQFGAADQIAWFNHATGHHPTDAAIRAAYRWLAAKFNLLEPDFTVLDELAAARRAER